MIGQKKFAFAALDLNKEAYIMHITYFRANSLIYPTYKAQIVLLLAKNVTVLVKYLDFTDVF